MLWVLLSTNLVLIGLAGAIVWAMWRERLPVLATLAGRPAGRSAAPSVQGTAGSDTLAARSIVAIQETSLRKLHVVAFANSGRADLVLDTVEIIAPKWVLISVHNTPARAWSAPARKTPLFLTVPTVNCHEGDTLLQCCLHRPLSSATSQESADDVYAVIRFSGAEMGGHGRRVAVTRSLRLPQPRSDMVGVFDPLRDDPQRAPASDGSRFERALAEAGEREEAIRIVLDAVLESTWRRALDRQKFQVTILAAAGATADEGPEAVRHAVFHAEAQKVLGWRKR